MAQPSPITYLKDADGNDIAIQFSLLDFQEPVISYSKDNVQHKREKALTQMISDYLADHEDISKGTAQLALMIYAEQRKASQKAQMRSSLERAFSEVHIAIKEKKQLQTLTDFLNEINNPDYHWI